MSAVDYFIADLADSIGEMKATPHQKETAKAALRFAITFAKRREAARAGVPSPLHEASYNQGVKDGQNDDRFKAAIEQIVTVINDNLRARRKKLVLDFVKQVADNALSGTFAAPVTCRDQASCTRHGQCQYLGCPGYRLRPSSPLTSNKLGPPHD